jgi:hypothetical protein
VWLLVRNPSFDGSWDAFNWPQLFLYAPILFFFGSAASQVIWFVAELFCRKVRRKAENPKPEALQDNQRTLNSWLRDSLRVCVLYITTCAIGDIPMALNYVAEVRGWQLHLWRLSAVLSITASRGGAMRTTPGPRRLVSGNCGFQAVSPKGPRRP